MLMATFRHFKIKMSTSRYTKTFKVLSLDISIKPWMQMKSPVEAINNNAVRLMPYCGYILQTSARCHGFPARFPIWTEPKMF